MQQYAIGQRLAAGFGLVLLALLLIAGLTATRMREASRSFSLITSDFLPELGLTMDFNRAMLNARVHFAYYLSVRKPGSLETGTKFFRDAKALMPKLKERVASTPELSGLAANTAALEQELQTYEARMNDVVSTGADSTSPVGKEWTKAGNRIAELISSLARDCGAVVTVKSEQQSGRLDRELKVVIGSSLLVVLAGVLTSIVVTRSVNRQLRQAVGGMRAAARQIEGAAQQLASSSNVLAHGASQQAASVEETSASCEEISSMARRSVDHARQMLNLVNEAQRATVSGTHELQRMAEAMNEAVGASDRVKRVIQVIDEIAFRTNILALNAAVEAARAGEAGAGFAVVADEVRGLAQRSAEAARQTAQLVEESVRSTQTSRSHLDAVMKAMDDIQREATETSGIAGEVSSNSEQQTHGIEQISKSLNHVDGVTQQVAAAAEENASTAAELTSQVGTMIQVAGELDALVR